MECDLASLAVPTARLSLHSHLSPPPSTLHFEELRALQKVGWIKEPQLEDGPPAEPSAEQVGPPASAHGQCNLHLQANCTTQMPTHSLFSNHVRARRAVSLASSTRLLVISTQDNLPFPSNRGGRILSINSCPPSGSYIVSHLIISFLCLYSIQSTLKGTYRASDLVWNSSNHLCEHIKQPERPVLILN